MNGISIGTAADLLGLDAEEARDSDRKSSRRLRTADPPGPVFRLQGNWKRREGVATRYELQLAIDRLLDEGKIDIADGALRLAAGKRRRSDPLTPEQKWAREDDDLRAYCERIEAHGSPSRKLDEIALDAGGISFADAAATSAPSPGAARYVLWELIPGRSAASGPACDVCPRCRATGGARDQEALVDTIYLCGGLEWVTEDVETVRRRARAKRKGSR